ncbi:MAG TPA: dienelactone hydrolase family protein [Phenylobacterium sp.]|jgi:carboxymethylenebutenolidase|uniref:dienelactone hydrolase family protein n=1 Tax=Phenylobacterium sp. TaxID=1871053 RepID=UPI002D61FCF6|nr:dienelactone hydrolase family protein [Phenylobacterium sp.]HZZ67804.1 dienelactone hydrolase family protein [Phenylobacterium sp.]
MCDEDNHPGLFQDIDVSRRAFGLSAAAAAALAATMAHAQETVEEKDVNVKTPDGMADAALFHPKGKGTWPAVLIWTDIGGLRPVFRDMGRRLAAQGYVVLVPNPFYRVKKAPIIDGPMDFADPVARAKIMDPANRVGMDAPGTERDAVAFLTFLDAQPQTNRKKKAGVQGYCMGGPLVYRTAAVLPDRIGGAVTCHGGGLVSKDENSPHLLIPKMRCEVYSAVAANDDARSPTDKDVLKKTFADSGKKATVLVYDGCNHGWCVKDNGAVYNEAGAERAWAALSDLYKRNLV